MRNWKCAFVFVKVEADRKFTATKVGLVKGLAFTGAALKHVEVLASSFVGGCFFASAFKAGVENMHTRVDDVAYIFEKKRGTLLSFLVNINAEGANTAFGHESGSWAGGLFADFIAANVGETDRVDHCDAVDDPTDLRLPVNRF